MRLIASPLNFYSRKVGTTKPITTVPTTPTASTITLVIIFSRQKTQEIEIIVHMSKMEYIFCFNVIPRRFLYFTIYLPITRFSINHWYNRSELRTYKAAVNNKKGVVGKPGITIPKTPNTKVIVPNMTNKTFILLDKDTQKQMKGIKKSIHQIDECFQSLWCGVDETRTRDPRRDRPVF